MSFNSSPERGGKQLMIVFTIRRQIVLIWGKNIKNSLEAYVYLTPSIMLLHHFPQKWKFKVFSLAQSQMWEVQWKPDKVNTSLFSFHAYLYRNSLLQNRSFFHPLCFWMKPRTRSMASVEPLLGGLVGWLAFVLMCFFITLQDYLKQLFSKHTCFLSHVSPVHLQIQ